MPQKEQLTNEWRQELGENWQDVHSKYLHTIGNLTLTGYNSELGYSSFGTKRDMVGGFRDSPLRLNRGLANLDAWNEEEIKKRAKQLSELALNVWPYPQISEDALMKYKEEEPQNAQGIYTIESHRNNLAENELVCFNLLRERIKALDPLVREEPKKLYVAYKTDTNFADLVTGRKGSFHIMLNMPFKELKDPKKTCIDVTNINHWANGDARFWVRSPDDIDYAMELIKQAFEWHMDEIV